MNASNKLPPDLEAGLAETPGLAPDELAPAWRLAEGADPMALAPAPDPARIRAIRATLEEAAARQPARPPLYLFKAARPAAWMAVAASVVLLMAAGLAWYLRPVTQTATAPFGQVLAVTLPDGSSVTLNSGATLRYRRSFEGRRRMVTLEGEAFFDVAEAGTPFVIETFNASVAVLGTRFNVRAWPHEQEAQTVVSVVSGIVQVTARTAPDEPIRLLAGEATRVARSLPSPAPPATAHLDEATAWRDGGFIFYDQPFSVIFSEIEHRFGIEITMPEAVRARRLTISRHKIESAEGLVRDLCQLAKLRYRPTANGFAIYEQ